MKDKVNSLGTCFNCANLQKLLTAEKSVKCVEMAEFYRSRIGNIKKKF